MADGLKSIKSDSVPPSPSSALDPVFKINTRAGFVTQMLFSFISKQFM